MEPILKEGLVMHHKSNQKLLIVLRSPEANGKLWPCDVYQDNISKTNGHYRGLHRITDDDLKENWQEELELA